jgi:P4 family phage/plasmid primase-like protien
MTYEYDADADDHQSQPPSVDVDSPEYWIRCGVNKTWYMQQPPVEASMLIWALHWAALGFFVFPACWPDNEGNCACGRKSGPHKGRQIGKAPLINDWPNEATRDPKKIIGWWRSRRWANANIGALDNTRSGLVVADNDKDSANASELRKILINYTRVHLSGGADYKWHGIFLRPSGLVIPARHTTQLGINLESSGQFLLPPSVHRSGQQYKIISDLPPVPIPADFLTWLQSLPLEKREEKSRKAGNSQRQTKSSTRSALTAAIAGGIKEVPPFTDYEKTKLRSALWYHDNGEWILDPREPSFEAWSNVLYPLAWLIRKGWPWDWVKDLFIEWSAQAQGLQDGQGRDIYPGAEICEQRLHACVTNREIDGPKPWNTESAKTADAKTADQDGTWDREGAKTINTIYGLVRDRGWQPPPLTREAKMELAERATQKVIETALQDEHNERNERDEHNEQNEQRIYANEYFATDLGNAKQLIARYGADIRFVPERKSWIIWDGTQWCFDNDGAVMRLAKHMTREMISEAVKIEDSAERREQIKHALKCQAAPRLAAMVLLAPTEAEIVIGIAKLDADPMLLGVENGVIDLRTGQFREARREDFITMQARVTYDPTATCPNWQAFQLKITVGDRELIAYKQRFMGYFLTGVVKEEVMIFAYGTGNNGKSTERETVFSIMGDYAIAAASGLLIEQKTAEGATPEVARLKGRRLVTINETREGDILNEARLKFLTGHDTISARYLYENPFDFYPTHKGMITTNHKPIVKGSDVGLWRRIHLWPYTVQIPNEEIERDFRERKLMPERSGILNWMLAGLRAYLQVGLSPPGAVLAATSAYREDMDIISQWLDERCIIQAEATIPTSMAYFDYQQWAKTEISWEFSPMKFRRNLTDRGFAAKKGAKGQRLIVGLKLKEPTPLTILQGGRPQPFPVGGKDSGKGGPP